MHKTHMLPDKDSISQTKYNYSLGLITSIEGNNKLLTA